MSSQLGFADHPATEHAAWISPAHRSAGGFVFSRHAAAFLGRNPALAMGALASVSALLSFSSDRLFADGAAYVPGLCFGLVLAAGASIWLAHSVPRLLAIVGGTFLAWWLASNLTVEIAQRDGFTSLFAVYGLAGGFIGSALTLAALALANRSALAVADWVRTLAIGTVAGLPLECFRDQAFSVGDTPVTAALAPLHLSTLLPLFLIWQIAVAASVGYGFGRHQARSAR